jgi:hypothetical protein
MKKKIAQYRALITIRIFQKFSKGKNPSALNNYCPACLNGGIR